MEKTRWEYWKANFKQGAVSAWDWIGFKGVVLDIVIGFIAGLFYNATTSGKLNVGIIAGVTLLVAFSIYMLCFLFFAIFIIPYEKHIEQSHEITKLQSIKDREEIIGELVRQRYYGVQLRNGGETLMQQKYIDPWWEAHEKWRNKTVKVIASVDENLANKWKVLGTFTPKRGFSDALSPNHRKKLQMFDAWLERLDEVIEELKDSKD